MDPESSSPLHSYDDPKVLQLEPLCDSFIARELGQRRFSEKQESEWVARVAEDVRGNERTVRAYFLFASFHSTFFKTDVVKRWLKTISLSTKPEFRNFAPPLTDEAFQLFVQFFWSIKTGNRAKANRLLREARHLWGLEPSFFPLTFNKFLESGDDPAVSAAAEPSWVRHPTGQALHVPGKSRKTLNAIGRKRTNRPSSSTITKRRATARPNFKKRRLVAKARQEPEATNSATSQDERMTVDNGKWRCRMYAKERPRVRVHSSLSNGDVDVAGSGEVASDSVEKRRGSKRKVRPLVSHEPFSY
jgi:hypothetical protein